MRAMLHNSHATKPVSLVPPMSMTAALRPKRAHLLYQCVLFSA